MRKYLIGGLVGFALCFSFTAYADDVESLIGKTIQGQTAVYLNGEKLDTAIIVDGKSYAPTRKIAESSGQKVTFEDGGIYLESQDTPQETAEPTPEPTSTFIVDPAPTPTPSLKQQLRQEQVNLSKITSQIARLQIQRGENPESVEEINAQIADLEEQAKPIQARIAELEAQQ